jgi:protein TonB
MKIVFNNSQKLNEIIFANRNKSYGAYVLRATYNSTLFKSLSIVGSTVFLFMIGLYIFSKVEENISVYVGTNDTIVIPYDGYKIPDKPKTPEKPAGGPATNNGSPLVKDSVPPTNTLTVTDPNPDPNPNGNPNATGTLTGSGTGSVATTLTVVEIPEPPTPIPAEAPEFEGGLKALGDFIRNNTVYPELAKEMALEGTVYVTFIVNEKGEVVDTKILKGIGGGCSEEANRVVNKLPKFKKPGRNEMGKPVKTIMNLPIVFKLK